MTDTPDQPAAQRAARTDDFTATTTTPSRSADDGRGDLAPADRAMDDAQVIEVVAETAQVRVERRETGGVRVQLVTEAEETLIPATTRRETVEVTRHPVNRVVDAAPEPRTEGDVTILSVVEEQPVVTTRLVVTEEIRIRRVAQTSDDAVAVTLRRQRAVISRLDDPDAT
ncbi:YsnF/AvaK domain-containing protein [Paracoccus luteus]|uniref:YsnF/AvaK domain-containing protein n=1 Tax=Paracoccus luteus TaxID=2508543 RepID=UPI0010705092|nr:YsnF/AvaK domain-containing protein [Paracoccus luteus]